MNLKPFNIIKVEYPEFYEWIKEISRWFQVEDFIVPDYKDGVKVKFYTKEHKYSISVKLPKNKKDSGYMGCIVTTRKPRAGEDWNRGNDLPDGSYSKETWDKIKNAIIAHELVKVAKKQKSVANLISKIN